MGADLHFLIRDQNEVRGQFASKVANAIDVRLHYNATDIPAEDMPKFYNGVVTLVDNKNISTEIHVANYEEAVVLYRFIKMIKKELS